MNSIIKLTLSFLIVISFAGLTLARGADELLVGSTVEVEARVVAINADGQSLELYDSPSRTRISVQLSQIPQTERQALITSDVRELLVRGRVSVVAGRLTIHAESVEWGDKEAVSKQK